MPQNYIQHNFWLKNLKLYIYTYADIDAEQDNKNMDNMEWNSLNNCMLLSLFQRIFFTLFDITI